MKKLILGLVTVSLIAFIAVGESAGDASLSLYLDFNQVSGATVSDVSGQGNDASIEGAPTLEDGKYKQAMQFGGLTDNKLVVAHNPGLNAVDGEITVMAWVYPTEMADWELVILKWQDEAPPAFSYHFSIHNSQVSLYFSQEDGTWLESIGDTTLEPNQWYHIAAVANGSDTVIIYLNGQEDGSVGYDGTILGTDVDVCIGGKIAGAAFPFHGKMDEVAVFNRALSQVEIQEAMGGLSNVMTAVEPFDKLSTTWAAIKD